MTPGLLSSPCCPQPQAGCELNQLFGTAFSTRGAWFGYILIYVHPWDRMRNSNKHLRKHSIYTGWFIQILNKWSSYPTESDIILWILKMPCLWLQYHENIWGILVANMVCQIRYGSHHIYIYIIYGIYVSFMYIPQQETPGRCQSLPMISNISGTCSSKRSPVYSLPYTGFLWDMQTRIL